MALAPAISGAYEGNPPVSSTGDAKQQALESFLRGIRVVTSVATLADERKEWADRASQRSIEAVAELIRGNPSLQGGYYKYQANKRLLKESDLERGNTQLRRMLSDRPDMARGLTKDDELFQWATRKFAGEDLPTWIEWEGSSDITDGVACHWPPHRGKPGRIFVPQKQRSLGQQSADSSHIFDFLWSRAVYELHNIQSHEEFKNLTVKANAGTITRNEYILSTARTEYEAVLRTRVFYVETYHPWAQKRGLTTNPQNWRLNCPSTFEKWIAHYPRGSSYPWGVYGDQYDDATAARELQAAGVNWRELKRQGGQVWQKVKTEVLLRQRAQQLWNKVASAERRTTFPNQLWARYGPGGRCLPNAERRVAMATDPGGTGSAV
ncbi:MAG TPA: hypothetical protein VMP01_16420 [Pirellulaceae bacterium]|nr:hypothetical protein [Pirellulaceae bacterium]